MDKKLRITTWAMGTSLCAIALMLLCTFLRSREAGLWLLSFLTALFLWLAVKDSRTELRGTAACAGYFALELICAWAVRSVLTVICLLAVHGFSALFFRKRPRNSVFESGVIHVPREAVNAMVYYGTVLMVYSAAGLLGGRIFPLILAAGLVLGAALLGLAGRYRRWAIHVEGDRWTLIRGNRKMVFSFSDITRVRRQPLFGYLIYVNHTPVCRFSLTMKNASVFWMKIRRMTEEENG